MHAGRKEHFAHMHRLVHLQRPSICMRAIMPPTHACALHPEQSTWLMRSHLVPVVALRVCVRVAWAGREPARPAAGHPVPAGGEPCGGRAMRHHGPGAPRTGSTCTGTGTCAGMRRHAPACTCTCTCDGMLCPFRAHALPCRRVPAAIHPPIHACMHSDSCLVPRVVVPVCS